MCNCVFCDIINKKIPTDIIYEDDYSIAFLSKDMESFGHTLVIPKQHYNNIFDIPSQSLASVMESIKNVINLYKKKLKITGINILNANGKDAQQSINHLHFHVIPRFSNDQLNVRPIFPKYKAEKEEFLKLLH